MKASLLLLIMIFVSFPDGTRAEGESARELRSFYSDGCTGFIDGPPGRSKLWYHCCFEHDLRYWFGGSGEDMDFTDLALKECVSDVAGSTWANVIYKGVRSGHKSPVKSKTHWSWGWSPAREPGPLTPDEIQFVEVELRKLALEPEYVDHFIAKYLRR